MAEVTLKNLTKIYGNNTVVDHINLTVPDGTLTSILGPSGCGKTTTLRMIAGFEEPQDGEIFFDTQSMEKVPVNKREIGMVFQSYALFPHMTVYQNVAYGLEQRKVKGAELEKRVMEALKMVHMEEYVKRKPKQLSGGQQQRVALARALVIRPKVLLLDECLSALDKKLRVEMQIELRRILEECHVTTFFVTHDQEEAMTLSDNIVVMNHGIIEQTGSPYEVYEHPKNRFVASFLGKANFIEKDGATYAIRPEKINIQKVIDNHTGKMSGTVETVTYSGNSSTIVVSCSKQNMIAEVKSNLSEKPLQRGDRVCLDWADTAAVKLED